MKTFACGILLLMTLSTTAQVRIIPISLTDTSQNVLYFGYENHIRITGMPKGSRISLSGGGATFVEEENKTYTVRVNSVTDDCYILVTKPGVVKPLAKKQFIVRPVGSPQPNWVSGNIHRDSLMSMPYFKINIPGCYLDISYKVLSYRVSLDSAESIVTFSIAGEEFSPALRNFLRNYRKSTLVTIDDIRVAGPGSHAYKIPGIVLFLKD